MKWNTIFGPHNGVWGAENENGLNQVPALDDVSRIKSDINV